MLIDVTLQDLVENHEIVHGASLAGGAGYVMWAEDDQEANQPVAPLPGSCRSPRGNPDVDALDVARGIEQLERICGC
jgi:hypothetical protein